MPDISRLVQTSLANGLEVLLYPSFDAPVASFQVWYRVGSRNETPGLTGASHWVEHMMFKGTERIGPGDVMLRINGNGGELNAFTSYDFTAYHETLPADRIAMAVEIEADRMTGLLIDPEATESERTVILSERQGALNNPSYMLWDETIGSAFRVHSYRHFVIGTEHDLKSMSRDDLYGHYRRYYAPNNAVVVVTGAFDADQMLAQIEAAFGSIPASEGIDRSASVEPVQIGERRSILRHPAPAPEVLMAWHVPGANGAEEMAFEMLSGVLSGAGGRMGRSARLPRNLVASGRARSASASYLKGIDPFVFLVGATGLPDGDPLELEALLLEQIADVVTNGVSAAEVDRARKLLTASYHFGTESVSAQANGLGEAAMYGEVERFFSWPEDLVKVTPDAIQAAATVWLTEKNRTVGLLYPTEPSSGGEGTPTLAALRFGLGGVGAPKLQPFERIEIEPGLVVLGQAQPDDPVVHARIRVQAGSADDPAGKHGLGQLAALLTMRGSGNRTREQFEEACDDLGASIGVAAGREHTEFTITCLAADLEPALDLLAGAWSEPTYADEQLNLARRESVASIRQAEDNTQQVADQLLRDQLFAEGHPFRHRPSGDEADLGTIAVADVQDYRQSVLSSRQVSAALVGGFASVEGAAALIASRFGGRGAISVRPEIAPPSLLSEGPLTAKLAGKEQADIALGLPVIPLGGDGWYALDVADTILGQFGLMGRIGESVRQQQGLAYYAYCSVTARKDRSLWVARAGVDPANIERAIESIRAVVRDVRENGFTAEELEGTIQLLTGRVALGLETNAGIAGMLLTIEEFGLGLDYVDRYPALVGAVTGDAARAAVLAQIDPDHLAVAIARPA